MHAPKKGWREAMLIPQGWGEREDKTRSMRWPKDLAVRVERVAEETGHEFTPALFHLVKWALDEYDAQRMADGKPGELKGRAKR